MVMMVMNNAARGPVVAAAPSLVSYRPASFYPGRPHESATRDVFPQGLRPLVLAP